MAGRAGQPPGTRYVTMWPRRASLPYRHICTVHRTLAAAQRAAKECERSGGAPHVIMKVRTVAHGG